MMRSSCSSLCCLTLAALLSSACGDPSIPGGPGDTSIVDTGDAGPKADVGPDADVGPIDGDVGCEVPCGTQCCALGDECIDDQCRCTRKCGDDRKCGSDGCGGTCGECEPGESCDADGKCVGCFETDEVFCARYAAAPFLKTCGRVSGTDICGDARSVNCPDTCVLPYVCDRPTNQCVCTPPPDSEVCLSAGRQCGTATLVDRCGGAARPRDCGSCGTGFECDVNNRCIEVVCVPLAPDVICAAAGKTCGMFGADNGCGAPVTVDCSAATGTTCVSPQICSNNVCIPRGTPSNDTCANPGTITFLNGVAEFDVDTLYANSTTDGTCGGISNDVVYQVTFGPGITELTITTTPLESSVQTLVYLRTDCGVKTSEVSSSCKYTASSNQPLTHVIPDIPPGTYYLWFDGYASGKGLQHVTLSTVGTPPPLPPTNDTCNQNGDAPIALVADAPATSGSLTAAAADYGTTLGGACTGTAEGRELVYSFTPYDTGSYVIVMTPNPTFNAVLWVSTLCGDDSACVAQRDAGNPETLGLAATAGTTYFIHADASSATDVGSFTIQIKSVLANDVCDQSGGAAVALVADDQPTSGDLSSATADYNTTSTGPCGGTSAGREVVYSFTPPATDRYKIVMTPNPTFDAVLWVSTTCGDVSSCVARRDGGNPETLILSATGGTTYFIYADTYSATAYGPFTIQVTTLPPAPDNDTCDLNGNAPVVLVEDDPPTPGDLSGATANYGTTLAAACGSSVTALGSEIVYSFTPATAGAYKIIMTPTPSFDAVLWVSSACGDTSSCVVHKNNGSPTEMAILHATGGTTYFIYADAASATATNLGPFTIQVVTAPPAPANDSCAAPLEVFADVPVSGDLTSAIGDFGASLTGTCTGTYTQGAGVDAVFVFTPTVSGDYVIKMDPDPALTFDAVLWVSSACGVATSCIIHSDKGNPETLTLVATAGNTYYIHADTYATTTNGGPFTLLISSPPPPPPNDTCAENGNAPIELVADDPPTSGDLKLATANYSTTTGGVCNGTAAGKEIVYSFTPTVSGRYKVVMTPSPSFNAVLWVSTVCGDASSCVVRQDAGSPAETLVVHATAWTTYFIYADASSATATDLGPFTIQVTTMPPAPSNDTCGTGGANAIPLTADVPETGDLTDATADYSPTSSSGNCGGTAAGAEVVYSFTPTADGRYKVVMTPSGSFNAVLWISTACGDTSTCVARKDSGNPETLIFNATGWVTYFIYADASSATATDLGPFTIQVTTMTPGPANDACGTDGANAIALTADVPETGTTTDATADYNSNGGACGTSTANGIELVYSFTPTYSGRFTIVMTPNPSFDAVLWVSAECGVTSSCLTRRDSGNPETIDRLAMDAGQTYYIYADAYGTGVGPFTIEVRSSGINDMCGTTAGEQAVALTLDASPTSGNLANASHDFGSPLSAACGANTASGYDLVYSYTPAFDGPFRVEYIPTTSFNALLWIGTGECGNGGTTCVQAANAKGSGSGASYAEKLDVNGTANVTYFIYADCSVSSSGGQFTIQVKSPPVRPANDSCDVGGASATVLSLDATPVSADTTELLNDFGPTLSAACGATSVPGRDQVYSYTPSMNGKFFVEVIPTSSFNPMVWLSTSGNCGDATQCVQKADAQGSGSGSAYSEKFFVNGVAGTQYFFHIDSSVADSAGTYTIQIRSVASSPCLGTPQVIDVTGATGTCAGGPCTGSTVSTANTTTGSCGGMDGNDTVFVFTTIADQSVTIDVTPDASSSTFRPAIYLRKASCDSDLASDQLFCTAGTTNGAKVTGKVIWLAAGTYYLWVDGVSVSGTPTSGGFTVLATLAAPEPGGSCLPDGTRALPLTLGASATNGNLAGAGADYGTSMSAMCLAEGHAAPGNELVYSYTPAADGVFRIVMTPTGFDAVLWVAEGTCGEGAACVRNGDLATSTTGAEVLTVDGFAGVPYFIYADALTATTGTFTLQIAPPTLSNDTCGVDGANAIPLTLGVEIIGDTTNASPDYGATLSATCLAQMPNQYHGKGRELVYVYTPVADGQFTIRMTPNSMDCLVWYSIETCGGTGAACMGVQDDGGTDESVTVQGVAHTRYFIYADSYSATTHGGFKLKVTSP